MDAPCAMRIKNGSTTPTRFPTDCTSETDGEKGPNHKMGVKRVIFFHIEEDYQAILLDDI